MLAKKTTEMWFLQPKSLFYDELAKDEIDDLWTLEMLL